MKKIILSMLFLVSFGSAAMAHPVKVTLSDGQVFYLESDNYKSAADMMADVQKLENTFVKKS